MRRTGDERCLQLPVRCVASFVRPCKGAAAHRLHRPGEVLQADAGGGQASWLGGGRVSRHRAVHRFELLALRRHSRRQPRAAQARQLRLAPVQRRVEAARQRCEVGRKRGRAAQAVFAQQQQRQAAPPRQRGPGARRAHAGVRAHARERRRLKHRRMRHRRGWRTGRHVRGGGHAAQAAEAGRRQQRVAHAALARPRQQRRDRCVIP